VGHVGLVSSIGPAVGQFVRWLVYAWPSSWVKNIGPVCFCSVGLCQAWQCEIGIKYGTCMFRSVLSFYTSLCGIGVKYWAGIFESVLSLVGLGLHNRGVKADDAARCMATPRFKSQSNCSRYKLLPFLPKPT
jgi:hypothetical protein